MNKEKIIIIGAGGHAKIVIEIIKSIGEFDIVGLIANEDEKENEVMGCQVYKGDDYLDSFYIDGIKCAAIGIGGYRDNRLRKKIYKKVQKIGYIIPPQIHPSAIISSTANISNGSVVFAGVIINPEVKIGENTIIATGSTIDHETVVKDHVLISAGVTVGASVKIEKGVLLALGSKVISGITIGEYALIAAGAVVVDDISANEVVFGIPAKIKQQS